MENIVSLLAVNSFMFHRDTTKRWKKVLCIVYYTQKTFNFVFLDVRLIIAFQTCNREFSYEFFAFFSHAANMAGLVCMRDTSSHVSFLLILSLSQHNMWFAVFLDGTKNNMVHSFWLMYDLCLFSLTNDKSFQTWLRQSCQYLKIKEKKERQTTKGRLNEFHKSSNSSFSLISTNQKLHIKLITL